MFTDNVKEVIKANNKKLLVEMANKILFESVEEAKKILGEHEGLCIGGGEVFYKLCERKDRNFLLTRIICMESNDIYQDTVIINRGENCYVAI